MTASSTGSNPGSNSGPKAGPDPSPTDVMVLRVGLLTAVGLSAAETAAAVRSGVSLFAESALHDHRGQPFTLAEVPEAALPALVPADDPGGNAPAAPAAPALTPREQRLVRLAVRPLAECLRAVPPGAPPPGLVLALPSAHLLNAQRRAPDGPRMVAQLARQVAASGDGGVIDVRRSDASHAGRAGGLAALHAAADFLRAGHATYMVAGGVDSYRDLYTLSRLEQASRLLSMDPDGFVPGEGAAFLLLATRATAQRTGASPLAMLTPAATAVEPGHLYSETPYRGEGLAAAVAALVDGGALPLPVREVYASMTGESHWGKEWGVSYLRRRAAFDPEHGMHHPADCAGDTGAACGPLLAGLAALGMAGRYRRSPALVYASSDDGSRAALGVVAA